MKRVIVQPAGLSGDALDDLKQWLGITRTAEDHQLLTLLQTSVEICEAYTGRAPLEVAIEERHQTDGGWQNLSSQPVRAITGIDSIGADNARSTLLTSDYEIEIDSNAIGSFRITAVDVTPNIIVSLIAGMASDWAELPSALKHGIIRLAAHHYLTRDKTDVDAPPAAVEALWNPWKQVRLT